MSTVGVTREESRKMSTSTASSPTAFPPSGSRNSPCPEPRSTDGIALCSKAISTET